METMHQKWGIWIDSNKKDLSNEDGFKWVISIITDGHQNIKERNEVEYYAWCWGQNTGPDCWYLAAGVWSFV